MWKKVVHFWVFSGSASRVLDAIDFSLNPLSPKTSYLVSKLLTSHSANLFTYMLYPLLRLSMISMHVCYL